MEDDETPDRFNEELAKIALESTAVLWAQAEAMAVAQVEPLSALERLASCVKDGVLQMRDVDRATVYKQHLGEKLRSE